MATTIPQRELRNNVSDVLRRAEAGERFTITVNGRPVAELGPPAPAEKPWPTIDVLNRIIRETPVDPAWVDELMRMRAEDLEVSRDPWAE